MGEWKEYAIEDICQQIFAGGDAAKYQTSKHQTSLYKFPVYANSTEKDGLYGYCDKAVVSLSAVTIAARGAGIGFVALRNKPFVPIVRLITLITNNLVDTKFLYYYLKNRKLTGDGSAIPQITVPMVKKETVIAPVLDEQKRIVNVLSSLDEKIETNRKISARLEELAQALFKSWFIDFEPFGGKMPEDWVLYSLMEITDIIGGYSYKGEELQPSSTAMATIKNFDRSGSFKLDGFKEIIVSSKCKDDQHVKIFDVLVAHTDLTQNADIIGNPALVLSKGGYEDLVYSMDLVKVVPKNSKLSNFILYHILKSKDFKAHALGYVNGTTVLHMSKKAIPAYQVYLPKDLDELESLNNTLKPIYENISSLIDESARLAELRDTLLPKLMSGEIKVE